MKAHFDVAVVGRGMLGAAAARYLADMGASVALIGPGEPSDRSTHDGPFGAHYDSGRIARIIDRNPYYAQIAAASIGRYPDFEQRTGIRFFHSVGHLAVSAMPAYLDDLKAQAITHELEHSILDQAGLADRFPDLSFAEGMTGIHETGTAGYIDPRRFIAAQQVAVEAEGGSVIDKVVTGVDGQEIAWTDGKLACDKVLLVTGAFANHFGLIPAPVRFSVEKHTVVFAQIDSETATRLSSMPSIIYKRSDDLDGSVYVLPPIVYPDGRSWVKIGQSVAATMTDPDHDLIAWFQGDGDPSVTSWLLERLPSLLSDVDFISTHSESCAVTKSPTGRQFIDRFDGTRVYALLADDGQVSKSADELGRMAAHRVLYGSVPDEYDPAEFTIKYR